MNKGTREPQQLRVCATWLLLAVIGCTISSGSVSADEGGDVEPPVATMAVVSKPVLDRVVLHERGALLTAVATVALATTGTHEILLQLDATGAGRESSYLTEIRSAAALEQHDEVAGNGCGADRAKGQTGCWRSKTPLARIARTTFDVYNMPDVGRAIADMEAQISEVDRDLGTAADRAATLEQQQRWIVDVVSKLLHTSKSDDLERSTSPTSSSKQQQGTQAAALFDAVETATEATHALKAKQRATAALVTNLTNTKARLLSQRDALRASFTIRVLRVVVDVVHPGMFAVQTSCVVRDAGWSPSYELRLDTKTSDLVVHYSAIVWQSSSANWSDIGIQLSTGSIEHRERVPELTPWRLTFSEPTQHRVERRESAGQRKRHASSRSGFMAHQMETQGVRATAFSGAGPESMEEDGGVEAERFATEVAESHSGLSDTFVLAGRHTVLRQQTAPAQAVAAATARLPIVTLQLTSNITTVVYPRQSSVAFLGAEFRNDSPYSMLPGAGQAFVDGSLVGNVDVPLVGAGGARAKIPLGTDRSVSVTRRTAQEFEFETSRWFFASSKESQAVRRAIITLENKRKHPVDVLVRELLPQPSHASMVIHLLDPPLVPHIGEFLQTMSNRLVQEIATNTSLVRVPGMVEWRLHLPQGSKKTIPFGYAVAWPQEKTLRVDP